MRMLRIFVVLISFTLVAFGITPASVRADPTSADPSSQQRFVVFEGFYNPA